MAEEQLTKIEEGEIVPDNSVVGTAVNLAKTAKEKLIDPALVKKVDVPPVISPEQQAAVGSAAPLTEAIEKDLAAKSEPEPTVDFDSLLNSTEPLSSFENVPSNITEQNLRKARVYLESQKNKTPLPENLKKEYLNSYISISNSIGTAKSIKQMRADNPLKIAFENEKEQILDKYKERPFPFINSDEYRYWENRSGLREFLRIGEDKGGYNIAENKPLVAKILIRKFPTGGILNELRNEIATVPPALAAFTKWIGQTVTDLKESAGQGSLEYYFKNRTNREQERKKFLDSFKSGNILASATTRLNEVLKQGYIEEYGQEAYDNLEDKSSIEVTTQEAEQLYDFSTTELNNLTAFVTQQGFNYVLTGGTLALGKTIGAGFRGIKVKGEKRFLTDNDYYLKTQKEKFTYNDEYGNNPFLHTDVISYQKYKNNKDILDKKGFDKLRQSVANAVKAGKVESGYLTVKRKESRIPQEIIKERDEAYVNLQKARHSNDKSLIDRADKRAFDAELKYTQALDEYSFLPSVTDKVLIPNAHLKAIAGAEALPSLFQSQALQFYSDPNDPSTFEQAQFLSDMAYLVALFSPHRIITKPLGAVASKIETLHDISYTFKKTLDDLDILDKVGIGLPKLLDTDISNLRMPTGEYNPDGDMIYRELLPSEYKGMLQLKTNFLRLAPASREVAYEQALKAKSQISDMVEGIQDPKLKKFLRENLRLSMAQSGSIVGFQVLGNKIANQVSFRDLAKVSGRALDAIKYQEQGQRQMGAHSAVLQNIENQFVRLENGLGELDKAAYKDIINLIRNTNKVLNREQAIQEQTLRITHTALKGTHTLDTAYLKTPTELKAHFKNMFDMQKKLDKNLKNIKPIESYKELQKNITAEATYINKQYASFMTDVSKKHSNYQKTLSLGDLSTTSRELHAIVDQISKEKGDLIYKPLKLFGEVNTSDIYNLVLDLNKRTSFKDGYTSDKFLSFALPDEEFARSSQGQALIKALDKNAEKALIKTFLKAVDEDLPSDLREATARDNMEEAFSTEKYKDIVRNAYNIPEPNNLSFIHFYDYFKNKQLVVGDEAYDVEPITSTFDELEEFYRAVRNRGLELKDRDKVAARQYSQLAEKIDNYIVTVGKQHEGLYDVSSKKVINPGKEQQFMRVEYAIEIANRQTDESLFGAFRLLKTGNKVLDEQDVLINKSAGVNFLKSIDSRLPLEKKRRAAKNFKEAISLRFGEVIYPKGYIDPTTGRLDRSIDLNAKRPDGMTHKAYLLKPGTVKYVLDPTTESGKAGIEMAKLAVLQMFKESRRYELAFEKFTQPDLGVAKVRSTLQPTKTELNSFLTDVGGTGLQKYKMLQEAVDIETTQGKKLLVNLDEIMKVETDIKTIIETDIDKAKQFNKMIDDINTRADSLERIEGSKLKVEYDDLRTDYDYILDFDPSSGGLLQKYIGMLPQGMDEAQVNLQVLDKFRSDLNFLISKNPKAKPEGIKKFMAGMLLEDIQKIGGKKTVTNLFDHNNKKVNGSLMENPENALTTLEQTTVRNMFKEVGVTDKQYNALLAVVGHQVIVKQYRTASIGSAISIPETSITDTGIISRAFNYARGLVSSEYLLVEAGFRMMRDNDMSIMHFILNEPDAAEILYKITQDKVDTSYVKYAAPLLAEKMTAYIARGLYFTGERLEPFTILTEDDEKQQGELFDENVFD